MPDAFGPFRVLHQVGAGTLGPVFRAYDADRARLVAVKVLRLDVPPERLHQLVAELERLIAADLAHPVVAAPIATGTDGLVIYLAQEYVPADSLDVVLRDEGPPAPADTLRVAAQLAGALDFAAAAKVYHGVLHPRDVLIAQDDTRLTGLGVAAAIEKIGVAAPRRRPYTAPERMAGAVWDRRADVFSLAALIHEMLWGRRLTAIGAEAAAALTELPGADLVRLMATFARALAPDPADRFQTAIDFATALGDAFPSLAIATDHVQSPRPQVDPTVPLPPSRVERASASPAEALGGGGKPDTTHKNGRLVSPDTRLPFEYEAGAAEGLRAVRDDEAGVGTGFRSVPELDHLELRPAEQTGHDEIELAPSLAWDPADDAAEPPAVALALPIAPLEDFPPLRNGLDGRSPHPPLWDEQDSGTGGREFRTTPDDDLRTSASGRPTVPSNPRSPLFQPYQADSAEQLDAREEPDEPPRSVMAPVAAALILGLALGFGGGYALGGRRGTPASPSAIATAPAKSAAAPARSGREFTEAAVGEPSTVRPGPAASARPSPESGRAVKGPDATSEKDTPKAAAASATTPGRLLVRSTPSGARLFVDGREQGQTPATVRDLARGTHRVRLTHDGYVAEERRIAITAAQPSQAITVDLKRPAAPEAPRSTGSPAATPATVAAVGALTVESRPDGARVFLDGRLVGTTPLSLPQVAAGEHAVRLEREGYRGWSSPVRVAGGQRQRVAASLEKSE